jgi:LicD family
MEDLKVTTWLAHGTLLGWYWNERVLPWDTDLDVQVWFDGLQTLAEQYNMTKYSYTATESFSPLASSSAEGEVPVEIHREYLLDINPNFTVRQRGNWMNIIDGRWIDTSNGMFIDITGLTKSRGVWADKCCHAYKEEQLKPLLETTFEGVSALVPKEYADVLVREYHDSALVATTFAG